MSQFCASVSSREMWAKCLLMALCSAMSSQATGVQGFGIPVEQSLAPCNVLSVGPECYLRERHLPYMYSKDSLDSIGGVTTMIHGPFSQTHFGSGRERATSNSRSAFLKEPQSRQADPLMSISRRFSGALRDTSVQAPQTLAPFAYLNKSGDLFSSSETLDSSSVQSNSGVFVGNFETGDFTGWSSVFPDNPPTIVIVSPESDE